VCNFNTALPRKNKAKTKKKKYTKERIEAKSHVNGSLSFADRLTGSSQFTLSESRLCAVTVV